MTLQRIFSLAILYVMAVATYGDDSTPTVSTYDLGKPFGFCTRSSRTNSSSSYNITGGGCYDYPVTGVSSSKVTTLTSTGKNMKDEIAKAIKNYSVIIFDGSKGDFIVSSTISFDGISGKTLIGINGAKLCTTWYATQEIINALNAAGVPSMSTSSGTGGTLSNGTSVSEEAEYRTRQIIINMTGDKSEAYRQSGVFFFRSCQNLIIRNLKFQGPGSIDVSGSDLVSFYGTTNCWVDHCDFQDGMDGNFDITQKSDFNTVSWCTFSYTSRSYMHQNTNLIGSSDSEATGYLNTTFAFNHWGTGCRARMPMARVGKIHMLNNYYTCTTGGNCINPRKNSEFLIEGNYFAKGVKSVFSQSDAKAVTWKTTNYSVEGRSGESMGSTVTVPYSYTVANSSVIPTEVGTYAGATLYVSDGSDNGGSTGGESGEEGGGESGDDDGKPQMVEGNTYTVAYGETISNGKQIECSDITMTYGNDGEWREPIFHGTNMESDGFKYYTAGENNPVDASGKRYAQSGEVPTTGTYYIFSPSKDGTLYVASEVFMNKKVFVTENGSAINFKFNGTTLASGSVIDADNTSPGYISFSALGGKEYYLFGESTKIMFYGFIFNPAEDVATGISLAPCPSCTAASPAHAGFATAVNTAGQLLGRGSGRGIVVEGGKAVLR